jgi:hypothetical protein
MKKEKIILGLSFILTLGIMQVNANSCNEGWGNPGTSCSYLDNYGCIHKVTFHSMLWGLIEWSTDATISCVD